jgi:hypothetical protein
MDTLHDSVAHHDTRAGTANESRVSAVSWSAIIGGAVVSAATTLVLSVLGFGIGLAAVAPWPYHGLSPKGFTIATAIWLVVVQWLSSAAGGYLTGRLRTKWVGTHTHEVFFRDTAHGFITWAVGTLIGAILLSSAASALTGAATDTAAGIGEGTAATAAIYTSLAMIIGAFISCVAAALGGQERDEHP